MRTPAITLAFALAMALAPAVICHADSPTADVEEVAAPEYLQPWTPQAMKAFLRVGTVLEWEQETGSSILDQRITKHPTMEVIAADARGITLRCTTQIVYKNTVGYELYPVTWEEELSWDDAALRLCPHLPTAAAAGLPSRVQLELDGAARDADFYVVERADGADRFWFSVDRPGLLLKFERETHCSVRINGEDISFRRVTERYTLVVPDASTVVMTPNR
ncbi:MAG: hypothetical protein H6839_17330 [Planctomycetes bacterium]|nr:hypothetical protein [Planctomycetota bacterium]